MFAAVDIIEPAPWEPFGTEGPPDPAPFGQAVANYYMTDPISRASETMAQCSAELLQGASEEATGTHG